MTEPKHQSSTHWTRPNDELIDAIPAAFGRLPGGCGSWDLSADRGEWRASAAD